MITEHDHIRIDPPYRAALTEAGLASVEAVLSTLGDRLVAWSKSSDTVYAELPRTNLAVYVKRYHYPRFGQRVRLAFRGSLLRSSRARTEYHVLSKMRRLGVQAVRPIAYGERRRYGFVSSCFFITEAVPEAVSLSTFIQTFARRPDARPSTEVTRARHAILTNLAQQVRHMHDAGFVHRDLFWRNVLVRPLPNHEFEFYFLDASVGRRIRVRQWRRDSIVGDLAALGVLAPAFCTRADQLRFIRAYLGTDTIGEEERQWMQLVRERAGKYLSSEWLRLQREAIFDRVARAATAAG